MHSIWTAGRASVRPTGFIGATGWPRRGDGWPKPLRPGWRVSIETWPISGRSWQIRLRPPKAHFTKDTGTMCGHNLRACIDAVGDKSSRDDRSELAAARNWFFDFMPIRPRRKSTWPLAEHGGKQHRPKTASPKMQKGISSIRERVWSSV